MVNNFQVFQLVLLPFCPESPRYLLITRQQEANARAGNVLGLVLPFAKKMCDDDPEKKIYYVLYKKINPRIKFTISRV